MVIDWNHFTPWAALSGGLVLGLASAAFVLLSGRILGISGILGGLVAPISALRKGDTGWRLAFLLGLAAAAWVVNTYATATGNNIVPAPHIVASYPVLIIAGLLVGMGTRCAAGCTSGHGVCGLSRFSLRSLVATLTFMGTGFITVFIVRHCAQ